MILNFTPIFFFLENISMGLIKLVNALEITFRIVCGLENIPETNTDILNSIIKNSLISSTFWFFFVFAIGLLLIFSVAAIIKNVISKKGDMSAVVTRTFAALLSMFIVLIVLYVGINIMTILLRTIDNSFSALYSSHGSTLATKIVSLCTRAFNVSRTGVQYNASYIDYGLFTKESEVSIPTFGSPNYFKILPFDIKIATNYNNDGVISTMNFNAVLCLFVVCILLVSMFMVVYKLMGRVYKIALLFVIMPTSLSTMPYDEGQAFKNWKDQFIQQLLLCFGAVIGYNVYLIASNIILALNLGVFFNILALIAGVGIIMGGMQVINKIFTGHNTVAANSMGAFVGAAAGAVGSMFMNISMAGGAQKAAKDRLKDYDRQKMLGGGAGGGGNPAGGYNMQNQIAENAAGANNVQGTPPPEMANNPDMANSPDAVSNGASSAQGTPSAADYGAQGETSPGAESLHRNARAVKDPSSVLNTPGQTPSRKTGKNKQPSDPARDSLVQAEKTERRVKTAKIIGFAALAAISIASASTQAYRDE